MKVPQVYTFDYLATTKFKLNGIASLKAGVKNSSICECSLLKRIKELW